LLDVNTNFRRFRGFGDFLELAKSSFSGGNAFPCAQIAKRIPTKATGNVMFTRI
jgi:hypothetical protein